MKEKQSHTLKTLIKDKLNYIVIVVFCLINILLSMFSFSGGFSLRPFPTTAIQWVFYILSILLPPTIGLLIVNQFRHQGIKEGLKEIDDVYKKYLSLLPKKENIKPRSMKTYLRQVTTKDAIRRYIIAIVLSVFLVNVAVSADINGLVAVIANIVLFISFGIMAMMQAEEYVTSELVIWYKIEINKLEERAENPTKQEVNIALKNLENYIKGEKIND